MTAHISGSVIVAFPVCPHIYLFIYFIRQEISGRQNMRKCTVGVNQTDLASENIRSHQELCYTSFCSTVHNDSISRQ